MYVERDTKFCQRVAGVKEMEQRKTHRPASRYNFW